MVFLKKNLVRRYKDSISLTKELSRYFQQSKLLEDYIEGIEISTNIIGTYDEIDFMDTSQLIIGEEDYYTTTLYGFKAKIQESEKRKLMPSSGFSTSDLKIVLNNFY